MPRGPAPLGPGKLSPPAPGPGGHVAAASHRCSGGASGGAHPPGQVSSRGGRLARDHVQPISMCVGGHPPPPGRHERRGQAGRLAQTGVDPNTPCPTTSPTTCPATTPSPLWQFACSPGLMGRRGSTRHYLKPLDTQDLPGLSPQGWESHCMHASSLPDHPLLSPAQANHPELYAHAPGGARRRDCRM